MKIYLVHIEHYTKTDEGITSLFSSREKAEEYINQCAYAWLETIRGWDYYDQYNDAQMIDLFHGIRNGCRHPYGSSYYKLEEYDLDPSFENHFIRPADIIDRE